MTIGALLPALHMLGTLAAFTSSAASTVSRQPDASAPSGGGPGLGHVGDVLRRQEAAQMQTIELQTQASIRKLYADTANSIASGHLDSGTKLQNALYKAAQGIHF
ncbi:hypothetical protein WKR88_18055 [Trinickia caryophylli]|uniref:Uncharacterized protein n=1 Tax=Trinickia caryophylli TaxID=28094 RepID=A0A1X7DZC3_TRICW|nr:hypothetical protein [Trinickia caryophylli]PMS14108.1 hypothetical protein C0Z17_00780 [Trinickia caryophylli]TRX17807.1 hypothetical protein FNF07_05920 [Trinickia caryophylli]WQE11426.1 hypothetical protein U0034_16995 [Trinickia caryophylli]SMF24510.1 hypothetical protein SAMN06295900_104284 [Trinickia caryophylli]GLU32590.1 hypothetical protein Busp01_24320 [Trinickia caryophylli]